jgi:hypothetical protein
LEAQPFFKNHFSWVYFRNAFFGFSASLIFMGEVTQRVSSYQEDVERLDSIPGISTRMAEQILAEIGTNIKA